MLDNSNTNMADLLSDASSICEQDAGPNEADLAKKDWDGMHKREAQKAIDSLKGFKKKIDPIMVDLNDSLIGMGVSANDATAVIVGFMDDGGEDYNKALTILGKAGLKARS